MALASNRKRKQKITNICDDIMTIGFCGGMFFMVVLGFIAMGMNSGAMGIASILVCAGGMVAAAIAYAISEVYGL